MTTENNTTSKRILIGSYGWLNPQWPGSYYPDDLPLEWQLSYYANDMECVLGPVEQWLNASMVDLQVWLEDLPAAFKFYFQYPQKLQGDRKFALEEIFSLQMGGVLVENGRSPAGCWQTWYNPEKTDIPQLLLADISGKSLREQRDMLADAGNYLTGGGQMALILTGRDINPASLLAFREMAELMDIA